MIEVTFSKQWIHFRRSDLWPPTSTILKYSKIACFKTPIDMKLLVLSHLSSCQQDRIEKVCITSISNFSRIVNNDYLQFNNRVNIQWQTNNIVWISMSWWLEISVVWICYKLTRNLCLYWNYINEMPIILTTFYITVILLLLYGNAFI